MIRISNKYLAKIIQEEAAKVFEAHDEGSPSVTRPGEEDYTGHEGDISKTHAGVDYDDDSAPEHEVVSDEILTHIYETIAAHLDLPSAHNDPAGVMVSVELETEDEFLDTILALVQKGMHVARHETEKDDNMLQMRMDKKGKRNFGGNKEDADLMETKSALSTKPAKKKTKAKKKDWIKGAVDPKHKGYCTPMTRETCTPPRKRLAKLFKGKIRKANLKKGKNPHGPG